MRAAFIILVLLSIYTLGCQKNPDSTQINPELQIAREINNRKIVVLGEQPHRHPSGYNEVIKILFEWFGDCKRNKIKSITLNFVMEYHESYANDFNKYLESGNTSALLDSNLTYISFEEIEFYTKLKSFTDTIKSFNNQNSGYNYKFKALGFEEPANYFTPEMSKKTIYESEYWFVKERDSVVSMKFMDYFKNNENDKYLFYYGDGHLQKGLVSKWYKGFSLDKDSCMGYFLADYLKRAFGEQNVLTINKVMFSNEILNNLGLDSLINGKLITKNDTLKNNYPNYDLYDYFYFNHYVESIPHYFAIVYSRIVFDKALEKLTILERNSKGTWVYEFGRKLLRKLSYVAGVDFKNVNDFKKWFIKQDSFNLSHFDSKEYRDNVFKLYSNEKDESDQVYMLKYLGIQADYDSLLLMDSSDFNKIWPEALKDIKFINAIGIYWAGYPDEKIRAKEYLKLFSKEDFEEPEKYLQWWRNVYHNYGI